MTLAWSDCPNCISKDAPKEPGLHWLPSVKLTKTVYNGEFCIYCGWLTEEKLLRAYMQPAVAIIANKIEGELLDLYASFAWKGVVPRHTNGSVCSYCDLCGEVH